MRIAIASLLAVAVAFEAVPARADGAFPDELQVFAPTDHPDRIVLSTNYGLILSEDDGATWSYVCEGAISSSIVTMYGLGPSTITALGNQTLFTSRDDGCSWTSLDLSRAGISSTVDLFEDPTRDDHAFVITYTSGAQGFDLYDVEDGGLRDVFPSGSSLLRGVEVARSDARVVYAARFRFDTSEIELLYSDDRGQTFTPIEHPELGAYYPGIAAVDPADPATIYLRLMPILDSSDEIAVSHDSGQTFTVLLTAPGSLSAFAVDSSHEFYAADRSNNFWYGDANGTVTQRAGPAVRCLAARAGVVYACGDATADGFVLGVSTDHGATFSPLVTPTSYQTATCASVRAVCPLIDGGPLPPVDAGNPALDAGLDDGGSFVPDGGPTDAGGFDAGASDAGRSDAGNATGPTPSGCGCTSFDAGFAMLAALLVLLRLGTVRRAPRHR